MHPAPLLLAAIAGLCLVEAVGSFLHRRFKQSVDGGQQWLVVLAAVLTALSIAFVIVVGFLLHLYPWGPLLAAFQLAALLLLAIIDLGDWSSDPFCLLTFRLLAGVCIAPVAGHAVGLRLAQMLPFDTANVLPETLVLETGLWIFATSVVSYTLLAWSIGFRVRPLPVR